MSPYITRLGSPGSFNSFGLGRRKNPIYTITPNTSSVNEGSSVTFNVATTNVPNGTTLYWTTSTVSGSINTSDFNDGVTSGSFTINNNFGSITRTLANDATTEGSESFQLQLRTESVSGTIVATSSTVTIGDTSLTPTYSVSPSTSSVNEGSSVTFTVTTTNVADGTTLYWTTYTNSGTINSSDFNDGVTSGSFTITSGSGSIVRTLANDVTTEGSESFGIYIRTVSTSGSIVATSSAVTISDTSTSSGQQEYTTPGTYSWVCPQGVTSVSVVAVGGGGDSLSAGSAGNPGWSAGGGGGGLGWKNNIAVTPGQSYTVVVGASGFFQSTVISYGYTPKGGDSYFISTSIVAGFGGGRDVPFQYYGSSVGSNDFYSPITGSTSVAVGGTYVGDGGGNGGDGGTWTAGGGFSDSLVGGGGAGGYTGAGGTGGSYPNGGQNGSGGGAGGGASAYFRSLGGGRASSGGGVGIYGQGTSGTGASFNGGTNPLGGEGGSGGASGPYGSYGESGGDGSFGAGAGLQRISANRNTAGGGAVRIIWGIGRSYPNNAA